MKAILFFLSVVALVTTSEAFAPFHWASNKYRYRASVCRSQLRSVVRALTKKNEMKVCLTVALSSLSRKNSLLERHFDVQYNSQNKKVQSYDPALRHVLQYTISRRLRVPYLGPLPFYSPLKVEDGGRARGSFTLGIHTMCHYAGDLKKSASRENIKRMIYGLSHMDFYGAFDAYRFVVLKGIALKKQPGVEDALNQLRKNRPQVIHTLHYLISLRRHLEGKANRHTPSIQTCFRELTKNTQWVDSFSRIKVAMLQTDYCQKNPRRCKRDFETMDRMAATVQSIEDLWRVCPINAGAVDVGLESPLRRKGVRRRSR